MDERTKLVLANCLREKADGYLVNQLVAAFPTVKGLMNVDERELLSIKGFGPVKAKHLISLLEFAKAVIEAKSEINGIRINRPADIVAILMPQLRYQLREFFVVVGISVKNEVLCKEAVSIGSLNTSVVHPREVLSPLIKKSAASYIVAHNHPSGDPTPSIEDIDVTRRLYEAGQIVGIDLLDHIVIGDGKYTSFKEQGLL